MSFIKSRKISRKSKSFRSHHDTKGPQEKGTLLSRLFQIVIAGVTFYGTAMLLWHGIGPGDGAVANYVLNFAGGAVLIPLFHFFYGILCSFSGRVPTKIGPQWLGTLFLYMAVSLLFGIMALAGWGQSIGLLSPGLIGNLLITVLPWAVGALGTLFVGFILCLCSALQYGHVTTAEVLEWGRRFASFCPFPCKRRPKETYPENDLDSEELEDHQEHLYDEEIRAEKIAESKESDNVEEIAGYCGKSRNLEKRSLFSAKSSRNSEKKNEELKKNPLKDRLLELFGRPKGRRFADEIPIQSYSSKEEDQKEAPLSWEVEQEGSFSVTQPGLNSVHSGTDSDMGDYDEPTFLRKKSIPSSMLGREKALPRIFRSSHGAFEAQRRTFSGSTSARMQRSAPAAERSPEPPSCEKNTAPQSQAVGQEAKRDYRACLMPDRESLKEPRASSQVGGQFSVVSPSIGDSVRTPEGKVLPTGYGATAKHLTSTSQEGRSSVNQRPSAIIRELSFQKEGFQKHRIDSNVTSTEAIQTDSLSVTSGSDFSEPIESSHENPESAVSVEKFGNVEALKPIERDSDTSQPETHSPEISDSKQSEGAIAVSSSPPLFFGEREIPPGSFPPPLDLLGPETFSESFAEDQNAEERGEEMISSLANFGVSAELAHTITGPTVIQYQIQLAPGTKVSKISALGNDIAMSMAVPAVRVEAPIPGTTYVGIELPNPHRRTVSLRAVLESEAFQKTNLTLPLPLGQTVDGHMLFVGLEELPHLLVAGTTGSGKSIFINNCITALCFHNSPADLRFIMVDPKRVEMGIYESLPHILAKPIVTPANAVHALAWAVREMNERYDTFSRAKTRNLASYNAKVLPKDRLPNIVIIVDELADLMMTASKEVEEYIARLAQMARATGIHLVLATQRPSVNVITGTIKANIPARVAFSLPSLADSRTILDMSGAQHLLGKGDMLFVSTRHPRPLRIQSPFMDEQTNIRVVEYLRDTFGAPEYVDLEEQNGGSSGSDNLYLDDPKLEEAIQIVLQTGIASSSRLQRQMRIGFTRAARLIDTMEQMGIVGPGDGAKPREIYVDEEEASEILDRYRS